MIFAGQVFDPYYEVTRAWRAVQPVIDEYQQYAASTTDGYVCLGILGNHDHLNKKYSEDHTPRSVDCITIAGRQSCPLAGWVYAIDGRVPDQPAFERWFLGQLRAGRYPHVKYFNINGRHWNRAAKVRGVPFAVNYVSGDDHLHMSFMPGAEHASSSILADYERHRTGAPAATEEDDMTPWEKYTQHVMNYRLEGVQALRRVITIPAFNDGENVHPATTEPNPVAEAILGLKQRLDELAARPQAQPTPVDTAAVEQAVQDALVGTAVTLTLGGRAS